MPVLWAVLAGKYAAVPRVRGIRRTRVLCEPDARLSMSDRWGNSLGQRGDLDGLGFRGNEVVWSEIVGGGFTGWARGGCDVLGDA